MIGVVALLFEDLRGNAPIRRAGTSNCLSVMDGTGCARSDSDIVDPIYID